MAQDSNQKKGFFITFEGGEGAGKTTQIKRLSESLKSEGHTVTLTREPGGTPEAERIRALLVCNDGGNWDGVAETLLVFAARVMHMRDLIMPALNDGHIVICDRFTDSTLAYQGYGRGINLDIIRTIQHSVMNDITPDLTFILDIDPRIGITRSNTRLSAEQGQEKKEDRFEKMDMHFHDRLRHGFLSIAKENHDRYVVINATQSQDSVFHDIWAQAQKRLNA